MTIPRQSFRCAARIEYRNRTLLPAKGFATNWVRLLKAGTILILFTLLPGVTPAQTRNELGKPFLTAWLPKDYGAESSNWAIVQDNRGVMYFGNTSGILEYDGTAWQLMPFPNKSICRSLDKNAEGRIYAGGVGDFGYLAVDPIGQLRFVSLLPQVRENARDFADVWVTRVLDESTYFLTENFLFRWTPAPAPLQEGEPLGEMKIWQPANTFHQGFVVDGVLYVRERGKGLLRLHADALQLVPGGEQFADERIYVMLPFPVSPADSASSVMPEGRGRQPFPLQANARVRSNSAKGEIVLPNPILIGTHPRGLFLYDGHSFTPFKTEADQYLRNSGLYLPGLALRNGNFLLNTRSGGAVLLEHSGRLLQTLDRNSGLPDNAVYYAYADPSRPQTQWLALDNGIARVELTGAVSFFDAERGLASSVRKITRHHGVLYVATNAGVSYLDAAAATFKTIQLPTEQSWDFFARAGQLLVATNAGVYAIRDKQAQVVRPSRNNDFNAGVFQSTQWDDRRVFVGINGLASLRWENGGWREEGRARGVQDEIRTLVETEDGKLWAGTYATGLLRFSFAARDQSLWESVQVERFGPEHGLPIGWVGVYEINHTTYFCSPDRIYRFDPASHRFVVDRTLMVTPPQPGWVLYEDQQQRVWTLGRGIAMGTRQAAGGYHWLTAPFQRFSAELVSTIYAEDDGVVWLGGGNGLIRYDSNREVNHNADYPALVRRVVMGKDSLIFGGVERPGREAPALPYVHNNLRFAYSATSYADAGRLQFQTRLEGFDEEWSNWSDKTEREYTNLPEGNYHFRVRAKNVYEHASREAAYQFSILPPWYRSWWAYGGYALVCGLLVFAVDRIQRRRLLAKERERSAFREAKLRAEAAELQARVLEAENARKTQELEAARKLQLSMLPQTIPQLPHCNIAVYMQTATEVGGDYYDFKLHEDGTLTAALGDATGHGLRAGTMVTATKSLFNALAEEPEPAQILRKAAKALKAMGFRELFMALTVIKLKEQRLQIAAAGMPFALLYRAATGQVEEVMLKGMPLGSFADFQYQQQELVLHKDDTVLLMSDGFMETFDAQGEMLGEEPAKALFAEAAQRSPEQIIAHLVAGGKAWAGDRPQDDDVTFLVIKVK